VIQSFEGKSSFVIGDCCMYVAQVFTSEKRQLLGGISVNLSLLTAKSPRVEIWYTSGGRPTGLLQTVPVPDGDLSLLDVLWLSTPIQLQEDMRVAIVVWLDGRTGTPLARWSGDTDNPYPEGKVYRSWYGRGDWAEVFGLALQFRAFSVEPTLTPTPRP
jgi:hypothetical protein